MNSLSLSVRPTLYIIQTVLYIVLYILYVVCILYIIHYVVYYTEPYYKIHLNLSPENYLYLDQKRYDFMCIDSSKNKLKAIYRHSAPRSKHTKSGFKNLSFNAV
jgi:hypothetical protein